MPSAGRAEPGPPGSYALAGVLVLTAFVCAWLGFLLVVVVRAFHRELLESCSQLVEACRRFARRLLELRCARGRAAEKTKTYANMGKAAETEN